MYMGTKEDTNSNLILKKCSGIGIYKITIPPYQMLCYNSPIDAEVIFLSYLAGIAFIRRFDPRGSKFSSCSLFQPF